MPRSAVVGSGFRADLRQGLARVRERCVGIEKQPREPTELGHRSARLPAPNRTSRNPIRTLGAGASGPCRAAPVPDSGTYGSQRFFADWSA